MHYSMRQTKQEKKFQREMTRGGDLIITLRFDDRNGNGHNTFSITGHSHHIYGCMHDSIVETFPEFAYLIPYHLCSTDGPLHYIANTVYHAKSVSKHWGKYFFFLDGKRIKIVDEDERSEMLAKHGEKCSFVEYLSPFAKEPNLEVARSCAIWPDATLEQLKDEEQLKARLPALIETFRQKMLDLGFIW